MTAVTTELTRARTRREWLGSLLGRQEATLVGMIVLLGAFAGIRNATFLTGNNLLELGRATVVYFVIACPLTLVVIAGGFDFSIGSVFTLGGIAAAWAMTSGHIIWPLAVAIGMAFGALVGLVNAFVINRLDVPPIIATLGMFYFISGVVVVFSGGNDIAPLPNEFVSLGTGSLLGIPDLIFYGIVIGLIYYVVLEHTRFGYNVRAVGGNRLAAVENGISAVRVDRRLYIGIGAVAALAGIIYTARTGSGQVSAGGAPVTLEVVSAVLIGGTSLFGGIGTITGSLLGSILFAEIDNALALTNINSLYENMVVGALVVLAVAADTFRRRRTVRTLAATGERHTGLGEFLRTLVKRGERV
jgi:ribose transport system permease protein